MTGLITSLGFTSSSEQVWRGTYWHSLAIVSEGYSLTMSLQTSFGTSWQYSWNLYKAYFNDKQIQSTYNIYIFLTGSKNQIQNWKLLYMFVTSNHQTTNFVFHNFFHEFFSASAVEKENKLFIGPKHVFSWFWTNETFIYFFNCWSWEKLVEKIGENKIGCLVVLIH